MPRAVLGVTDQAEFLTALAGDPKDWKHCTSFFTCGTPMANDAGAAALTGKRDFDAAKRLIAEAGYKGEKIVILDAVDLLTNHIHALVAAELFKKLGLNVELATSDWGTVVTRRCRPFLTRCHWRRRNSWRHDHRRQSYRFKPPTPSVRSSIS
jgi:peptide/nickel transport system substrate-binding protein